MKKTMPRKKLPLHRTTIANLAGPALQVVVGGVTGPTEGAGITSIMDSTIRVLCNIPLTDG